MARTVQPAQYAARENEILDAAQTLIYQKGYAQMTIQDILDALQISKGAFYHYFDSKQGLLEAVVARMVAQMTAFLRPIVQDASLPALPKLEAVFRLSAGWKLERRALMYALLKVWYADENALVRAKLSRAALAEFGTLLQPVIAQGMAEGVMQADDPELAGMVAMSVLQSMATEMGAVLLAWDEYPDALQQLERLSRAYTCGVERVLGMARGAVTLIDPAMWSNWGAMLRADQPEARSQV